MNPEITTLNLPEILGRPKRGIIFSDLDGVWFDEAKNFAKPKPKFTDSITLARNAGFWVVLNSDTGPETLAAFANQLNANPWVVAENGGVMYIPGNGYWFSSPFITKKIEQIREKTTDTLAKENPKAYIWKGDATPFIQSGSQLQDATSGQTVYLINTARITSLGIYTRKVSKRGVLTIDDETTQKTEQILQKIIEKENLQTSLACKRYPTIGSCLVKNPSINKPGAVRSVIDQYGTALSYWMIGDTVNDSMISLRDFVCVGAVGNADARLKSEAEIVAPKNIAEGADFIIRKILEKEGI